MFSPFENPQHNIMLRIEMRVEIVDLKAIYRLGYWF